MVDLSIVFCSFTRPGLWSLRSHRSHHRSRAVTGIPGLHTSRSWAAWRTAWQPFPARSWELGKTWKNPLEMEVLMENPIENLKDLSRCMAGIIYRDIAWEMMIGGYLPKTPGGFGWFWTKIHWLCRLFRSSGMLTIFVELPQCLNAHRYVAYDIYDMYTMNIQRNLLVKIERISKRNPGVFLVALSLPSRLF